MMTNTLTTMRRQPYYELGDVLKIPLANPQSLESPWVPQENDSIAIGQVILTSRYDVLTGGYDEVFKWNPQGEYDTSRQK